MSKFNSEYFIKQKSFLRMTFVLLFCLTFAMIIFCIKKKDLNEYNIYDGRVVGFVNVTATQYVPSLRGNAQKSTYSRDIPVIEYKNKSGKIVTYQEGQRVIISSFKLNQKLKVLENKKNCYNTVVFSFFYYWFHIYELVIFLLSLFIFYVFISAFIFKDFYISDF